MGLRYVPEANNFGLVLPPTPEDFAQLEIRQPQDVPDFADCHHLYWPRKHYGKSDLSRKFREHRFNTVWLPRSYHDALHNHYDGVPIPPRDVMKTFLHEASILDKLDASMRSIEAINAAFDEGRVRHRISSENHRSAYMESIQKISSSVRFELMPSEIAQMALSRAMELTAAA